MSYDLPGPGDAATWGASSAAPGSPIFRETPEPDPVALDDDLAEITEWIDTLECAARSRNVGRMRQAKAMVVSKIDTIIDGWKS